MNLEQTSLLQEAARKITPCRNLLTELVSFGGNCTKPEVILGQYEATLKRALELDREIEKALPAKTPGDETKLVAKMTQLEMMAKSVLALADQLTAEVFDARQSFFASSSTITEALQAEENKIDEKISAAFLALAKELHNQWILKEKHFRLTQFLTGIRNEHPPMGMQIAPPSELRLGWAVLRDITERALIKAYTERFLLKD